MLKRVIFLVFLSLCLFIPSVFSACSLSSTDETCELISDSFPSFSLQVSPDQELQNLSARFFLKSLPGNELELSQEGNSFTLLEPLQESGVYVFNVNFRTESGLEQSESFEYVFKDGEVLAPTVPISLESNVGKVNFSGKAEPFSTVSVSESETTLQSTESNAKGEFSFDFTLPKAGWNLLSFETKRRSGEVSEKLLRTVHNGILTENPSSELSSISIDSLETLQEGVELVGGTFNSEKRTFYVQGTLSGTNLKGALVFVHGQRVLADENGHFGAFVNLNEGANELKVLAGEEQKVISVNYENRNFQIESFEVPRLVNEETVNVKIRTSEDLPLDFTLNGKYVGSHRPVDGSLFVNIANLLPGKNILHVRAERGEEKETIIYRDTQEPEITQLHRELFASNVELVFKIQDDTGVDEDSLRLLIEEGELINTNRVGDLYTFELNKVPIGFSDYTLVVEDRFGKEGKFTGTLEVTNSNPVLEDVLSNEAQLIGDLLFVQEGTQTLILKASEDIVFDRIFIDSEEVTDYTIRSDSTIELQGTFTKEKGEILFIFADETKEKVSQSLSYYADSRRPQVRIDYMRESFSDGKKSMLVSGKVEDDFFDFDSLKINGEQPTFFASFFEARVLPETGSGNLRISGSDLAGNQITPNLVPGLSRLDRKKSSVSLAEFQREKLKLNLGGTETGNTHKLLSYDGFDLKKATLPDSSSLPLSQYSGLRSLNLEAEEESGLSILSRTLFSVDEEKPQAYLLEHTEGVAKFLLDGTYSDIVSKDFSSSSRDLSSTSCTNVPPLFKHESCVEVLLDGTGSMNVELQDAAGNTFAKAYDLSNTETESKLRYDGELELFFSGNNLNAVSQNVVVQGHYLTASPIEQISLQGSTCEYDEQNFLCPVELAIGENNLIVNIENKGGERIEEEITIVFRDDLNVDLLDVFGFDVRKLGDNRFLLGSDLSIRGTVNEEAVVSVLVDGFEKDSSVQNEEFVIFIDLSEETEKKTVNEFNVTLRAENKEGVKDFSSGILLLFRTVSETFVKVIVG